MNSDAGGLSSDGAIAVRLLCEDDAKAYTQLRREMLIDSPWAFGSSVEDDSGLDAAAVAQRLKSPGYRIIGAFEQRGGDGGDGEEQLVGAAGVLRHPKAKMAHTAEIWGMYVSPACRGRGVGERVLRKAIEIAQSWEGVRSIRLSASARSPEAIRLYERVGFKSWGTEPELLMVDGVAYDEVHMVLFVDRE